MEDDLESFRTGLRANRVRAGLTQRELAELASVSVRTVRGIEQGAVRPRRASLLQLARAIERRGGPVGIGVLGPVVVDGVGPRPAKVRALLGLLALHANENVAFGDIVDVLWGDAPPATWRELLHGYASRLRKLVGDRVEGLDGAGYALRVETRELDLLTFDALAARQRWDEALHCWRGPLPEELRSLPRAVAVTGRRLAATLARADQAMASGDPETAVSWLRRLAPDEQWHEGLHARLMLALTAAGQQGEALAVHAGLRRRLLDDLGVEPGAELAQAQLRVLRREVEPVTSSVPRQLPADPALFVGRHEQLAALDAGRVIAVCGAGGMGKTWLALHWAHRNTDRFPDGQLYFDLRGFDPASAPVAAEVAVRAFLEALGVEHAEMPSDPQAQAALYRSLTADKRMLVVLDNVRDSAHAVPLLPGGGCTAVLTSRNRLPGLVGAHGAVVVGLDVLDDAEARAIAASHLGEARLAGEPDAAIELVRHCAGLPLALGIVAARVATSPDLPLAALVGELRAARLDALDAGEAAVDLRSVLATSYRALPERAARTFRLMALAPGPDIGADAVSCLAGNVDPSVHRANPGEHRAGSAGSHGYRAGSNGSPAYLAGSACPVARLDGRAETGGRPAGGADPGERPADSGDAPARPAGAGEQAADLAGVRADRADLAVLCAVNLVQEHRPGRFRMHDLTKLHALELGGAAERARGTALITDFYLHSALAADRWLYPHRPPLTAGPAPAGCVAHADVASAMAWYTDEYACLLAAQRLPGPSSWHLARLIGVYQWRAGKHHDTVDVWRVALAETGRLGDPAAQLLAHRSFGDACAGVGDLATATEHLERAVDLAAGQGETTEEAHAHNSLAWLHDRRGHHERVVLHATCALALYRRLDRPQWQADMLNCIGWAHAHLGSYELGRAHCEAALALCRRHDHVDGAAHTLKSLGFLAHRSGDYAEAVRYCHEALTLCRRLNHSYIEASVLTQLGESEQARGRAREAGAAWREALDLYRAQRRTAAARKVEGLMAAAEPT
ncbi:BTAD domain-containing putative transcriptional regulator [Actinosynnema sp. NPDC050436]|uniref:BTAD domain-containing putative transcriptional regulator n=1 Tax=Actinosynnema sp. NPDC050436 TaxID=3155659 RepID=UPI0033E26003